MTKNDAPVLGSVTVDPQWKIAIIRSVWYPDLTSTLVADAKKTLVAAGIPEGNIHSIDAPGSFEIPLLSQKAMESGIVGVIALGIIVQGATHHARLVAEQSAFGCMKVQLDQKKPVVLEVLFVNTLDDARSRVIGPDAKGPLAARTLLTQLANMSKMH